MNCTICKLPTGNIVGSVLPQCKCGWQAPQPPVTQRTWADLTDEEILHRIDTHIGVPSPKYPLDNSDLISFARAIEHESKGKNT